MSSSRGPGSPADMIRRMWASATREQPPQIAAVLANFPGVGAVARIEAVVADAQERWEHGLSGGFEHYRSALPELAGDAELLRALLMSECAFRSRVSIDALRQDFVRRLPEAREEIDAVLELVELMRSAGEEVQDDAFDPGTKLGMYTLVEWLGAGSFGEVWCAWDRTLERYIALKLLHAPGGGAGSLDRVLAEAQAAAALDHENIVKVHAAGRLPGTERCYIDCQLVGDPDPTPEDRKRVKIGRTLSAMLVQPSGATQGMEPREAARIMEAVCRGVAAAHARGIVHRDIKPSNILMTGAGRPLVTDFGLSIAAPTHALEEQSITATISLPSKSGPITGTPAFMSPEQAEGKPALPASDVYSLGATLRFLLTGKLPFQGSGKYHADARWDVVEQVRRRELRPLGEVSPGLPRDLTAICDKAMSFEPERRYVSAQQLAEDLAAWLGHRTVSARPAGTVRSAGLWARRNVAVTAVAGVAIVLGGAGAWRYVVSINRALERAVSAENEAKRQLIETRQAQAGTEAVNSFLKGILSAAAPEVLGADVKMLDAVRFSAAEVAIRFEGQPRLEAQVRATLGLTYRLLGQRDDAKVELERALEIQLSLLGEAHRETIWTRHVLLIVQGEAFQGRSVVKDLRPLLDRAIKTLGPDDSLTLAIQTSLGIGLSGQHLFAESSALLKQVVEAPSRGSDVDMESVLKAKLDMARNSFFLMRGDESIKLLRECVADFTRLYGREYVPTLNAMTILGNALTDSYHFVEAEPILREALAGYKKRLPPGFDYTLGTSRDLARVLLFLKRPQEAVEILEPEFAAFLARPDHNFMELPRSYEILSMAYIDVGRLRDAEGALLKAYDGFVKVMGGEDHMPCRRIARRLANLYAMLGEPAKEAEFRLKGGAPEADPAARELP